MKKFLKKLRERLWLALDRIKTNAIGAIGTTATRSIWNRYPRTSHFAYDAIAPLLLVSIAFDWINVQAWAYRLALALFTEALMLLVLMGIFHRGFLCEHCISRFPLDGEQQAVKRRGRLYSQHYRVKWLLVAFVAAWVVELGGSSMGLHGWRLALALSVTGLPAPYWFWCVARTHDRLQVWCPYCRDDGGDGDHAVDPAPTEMIPA